MKRYSLLGISLTDYTAREALKQIDRFLQGGSLNTVACLTVEKLTEAAGHVRLKEMVESMDLTLCVEGDILEAAGIASPGRIKEISEKTVLRECLKKVSGCGGSVFVLGDTYEKAQEIEASLHNAFESVRVVGCEGVDGYEGQTEQLMNVLNDAAPTVIFSGITWPKDLELMISCRRFLNAMIWYALPEKEPVHAEKRSFLKTIQRMIFRKKVTEYNNGKAD